MSVTTQTLTFPEWRLWGQGYAWSTRYTGSVVMKVTRNTGSDTASVEITATMTTPSGDTSLGDWECVATINGASSGGGEKTFSIASAGYHAQNSSFTVTQTYTVNVGVSAGTLTGTVKLHIGGYSGYQGEYSDAQSWSLTYETKGTPSQATWSNYYFGNSSTITIQRTVPDFRESVYLVWQDDTSHPVTIRTYSQSSATTISYTIPYNTLPYNATTRSAKIRVVTYNGSTQIGTWETSAVSVTIKTGDTHYNPTLSANPTCEAYNDVVSALGTDTAVAQYSKLNVKAKKANVVVSTDCPSGQTVTIVSRVVTFSNGSSASADQENHISSVYTSAGTATWTYTVTDSRGLKVTRTGSYTVINSSAPTISNVTIYRGNSSGTAEEGGAYIYATATASCENLNGHNSVTLKGKVDSGAYQSMTSGTRKTLKSDANANTQYLVTLTATDLLRETTQTILLPSLDCPLDIPETKHAVGVGMQAQASDDTFYVGYKAKFYGDIVKHDSVNNRDMDLWQTGRTLVGAWGTPIPANTNLNTAAYREVGTYYCSSDATATTLTNCPTQYGFTMEVLSPIVSDIANDKRYRIRIITDNNGGVFLQRYSSSWDVWQTIATSKGITMTGQILTSFKSSVAMGSYQAQATTIPALCTELCYSSGCCGSAYIVTYTFAGDTMNEGWYNFLWIPHRSGGLNGNANLDNTSYGTCFLSAMSHNGGSHILRFSNGSITELRRIVTNEVFKDTYSNSAIKNGSAICRREGNIVTINATGDCTSLSANTSTTWVTVDSKYRPSEDITAPVANSGVVGRFATLKTDGRINLYSTSTISSASSFAISYCFIKDN